MISSAVRCNGMMHGRAKAITVKHIGLGPVFFKMVVHKQAVTRNFLETVFALDAVLVRVFNMIDLAGHRLDS